MKVLQDYVNAAARNRVACNIVCNRCFHVHCFKFNSQPSSHIIFCISVRLLSKLKAALFIDTMVLPCHDDVRLFNNVSFPRVYSSRDDMAHISVKYYAKRNLNIFLSR